MGKIIGKCSPGAASESRSECTSVTSRPKHVFLYLSVTGMSFEGSVFLVVVICTFYTTIVRLLHLSASVSYIMF